MPDRTATAEGLPVDRRALQPVLFSTDQHDPRHRFDAWQAAFGTINDIHVPPEARPRFQGRCAAWTVGSLTVTTSDTPAMRLVRGIRHAARDGLDHWVIRVARTGTVRSRFGEAAVETGAGQPVLYSVGDGFDGDWSAAEWTALWIPRDTYPTLTAGLSLLTPGPQPGAPAALLADLILSLPFRLATIEAEEAPLVEEAIRGMIAMSLMNGGGTSREKAAGGTTAANPLLRERVRRIIRANIRSARLTPERIARAAGISRTVLYRLFEPEGGVARHVQKVRLGFVHAAIGDPMLATRSISALAEEHGFHDPSAFSRAFRRAFGCAPSDVRAAALRGSPAPAAVPAVPLAEAGGNPIARLLRHHAGRGDA